MTSFDIEQLQAELADKNPRTVLKKALALFDNIAISFSGAEDVVLIDMALKIRPDIPIFSLDTGRLHPETYRFIEKVRKHYQIDIELLTPDRDVLDGFVKSKGLFSFYEDGHQQCCGIRKVEPLKRKLAQVDAWITGQRKDQSLDTRQHIPEVQQDSNILHPSVNSQYILRRNCVLTTSFHEYRKIPISFTISQFTSCVELFDILFHKRIIDNT